MEVRGPQETATEPTPPTAIEEQEVAASPTKRVSTSLAIFTDDSLSNCFDVSVSADIDIDINIVLGAMSLEVLEWWAGKDTLIGEGKLELNSGDGSRLLAVLFQDDDAVVKLAIEKEKPQNTKKFEKKLRKDLAGLRNAIAWPHTPYDKQIKLGEIARIQSCASTQKFALGTCTVVRSGALSFEVNWYHYGIELTTKSDKGMKLCLAAQGLWKAPPKGSVEATKAERAQRRKELESLLQ